MSAGKGLKTTGALTLDELADRCNSPSWTRHLDADPETVQHEPNKVSRQVRAGHYVQVKPSPLPSPSLVSYSPWMLAELSLSEDVLKADPERMSQFARFFSGDIQVVKGFNGLSWATPYALSIYGREQYQNCPFGNGNGYGDGRAISIGEVLVQSDQEASSFPQRWELQLKGAGTTPFCRGGDGRAVFRSSIREFLVSEAMHHMGISTTRALSLVKSGSETSNRPWYQPASSEDEGQDIPSIDDPRLAHIPLEHRRALLAQFVDQQRNPDVMISEPCAITCRAAPSFLRVGHVELFSRRVAQASTDMEKQQALAALRKLANHALYREYPHVLGDAYTPGSEEPICLDGQELQASILQLLSGCSQRLARLTAGWIRVGFVQGNFNSDNCLVGGRTMDYGPFGFVQKYSPLWNMWVGGGEHFAFLNQGKAGHQNFKSLVTAMLPLLDEDGQKEAQRIAGGHYGVYTEATNDVWRRKLGLEKWSQPADALTKKMLGFMEDTEADYTLFWRQLSWVPQLAFAGEKGSKGVGDDLLRPFRDEDTFYKDLSAENSRKLETCLLEWLKLLKDETGQGGDGAAIGRRMRSESPMFVPREWMLVDAYKAAYTGDYSVLEELKDVFAFPYATELENEGASSDSEGPGQRRRGVLQEYKMKYFKKAPAATYKGAGLGGTSYMS